MCRGVWRRQELSSGCGRLVSGGAVQTEPGRTGAPQAAHLIKHQRRGRQDPSRVHHADFLSFVWSGILTKGIGAWYQNFGRQNTNEVEVHYLQKVNEKDLFHNFVFFSDKFCLS